MSTTSPTLTTLYLLLLLALTAPFFSQAAFRTDLSVLLDQIGTGKESLSFMKRRIRRLSQQWALAAYHLDAKLESRWRDQKKVRLKLDEEKVLTHNFEYSHLYCTKRKY